MKYFPMTERIDKEMLQKFISFYNENFSEPCSIILNTVGGHTIESEVIIHMINKMPDVTLVIQYVYSAGLEIAMNVKCKKILSKVARGMWHLGRVEMSINLKNKPYWTEDECIVRNLPIEKKSAFALAKKIMTAKEYAAFKKDQDVYFDFKRMKQIFPDAEVMK